MPPTGTPTELSLQVPTGLWYFADAFSELPSTRAHSVQIMKVCSAFAQAGQPTTLVAPLTLANRHRLRALSGSLWEAYAVPRNFEIAWCHFPYPFAWPQHGLYAPLAGGWALAHRVRRAFTRNSWIAACLAALGIPVAVELHKFKADWGLRQVRRLARTGPLLGIICVSQALASEVIRFGCPADSVLVAHNAVDLERFEPALEPGPARAQLDLPPDQPVVCYAGNLHHDRRGLETLLASAARLPEATFLLVGGRPMDVAAAQTLGAAVGARNLISHGHVPVNRLPTLLQAAAVLVMPYTTDTPHHRYMSPMKLPEYMAAGRPIVASNLPVLRETLTDGENALLVEPGDPEALVNALRRILHDPALAQRLAARGRAEVQANSWRARQASILAFLDRQAEQLSERRRV